MSVKIRLARAGAKKRPFYRIIATDSRSKRDGRFLEKLGTYDPLVGGDDGRALVVRRDRVAYWMGVGALPSDAVTRLLRRWDRTHPAA